MCSFFCNIRKGEKRFDSFQGKLPPDGKIWKASPSEIWLKLAVKMEIVNLG